MTREEVKNSLEYQTAKEAWKRYNIDKNFDIINFEEGSEYGYNFAVNKACEWLERNYHATPSGGYYYLPEDCIEQFRKAMKGD